MATDLNTEFRAWRNQRNQRNQSADDTGTDLNSEFNAWRKQQTPTPAATAPQAGIAGAGATTPVPVAPAPVDQGSALEDVGRGLLAGGANLIGAIGDIPNFVTGGYVPSFSQAAGLDEFAESQRKHYQPETKRQMQALQDAEGFFGTLAAIPENIGGVGQYLVESIPSFVPGIGAAGIAAKTARAGTLARGGTAAAGQAAAKTAATRAAVGTEAVLGGGFAGSQAAEQVRNMPADKLASLDDFQKLIAGGQTPEQARETLAAQAGQVALPIGAAIGGLAGRLGAGVESRLVAGEAASESGKPLSNALAAILTQGAEETVQEGGEQFAGNVGTRRIDPSQSLTEGVPEAAALGLALGGASGGGLAGAGELAGLVRGRQAPPPVGRKTQRTAGQESQRTIADTAADVPIERQATRQGMAELYNDVPDIKQGDTVVHLDDDSTAFLVSAVQADGKVTLTDMETGASVQRDVTEVAQNFGRLNPVAADNGQETSPPDPGAATASFATQAANRQQGQASPPASVPVTTDDPNNRAAQAGLNAESESSGTADGLQPIQPGSPSSPSQPAPVGSQAAAAADQATQSQASQQTVPQQSTENNSIPQDRELLVERIKTAQTPEEIGAAIAALRQFDGTAAQQDQRATTVQTLARGDASAETRAPSGYSVQEQAPLDDSDRASAELFAPNSRAVRKLEPGQQPDPDVPAADAKNQAADNFSVRYEHEEVGQLRSGLDRVKTAADVAHAVADIRRHGQETMLAVVVDKRGKILSVIRHTKGLKNESTVDPMTLVGAVAATEGAAGVWWAHNHPSGSPVPSGADYRITQRLDEALSGTGISAHGHVVVAPGGRAWTFKDQGNTQPVSIRPVVRNRRLSLTERVLRKRKNAEIARVRDPEDAVNIASELRADSAIMLLDNQLTVVGSVAMTPAEMRVLRDGGRVNRVLRAIDATNANSFIIKTKDQGAAENVTRFLRGLSPDARVLDWIRPGFDGQWASDQAMGGGSVAASTGPFFSRKRQQGKQNETATATPAAGTGSGGLRDAGGVPGSAGVLASTGGAPAGSGSRETDGSLRGLPRRVKFRGGEVEASHWPVAGDVARQYVESQGRQYAPPSTYARVDRDRAARIAQAYDQMPHAPDDPEVRRAYRAMIDETLAQYQAALDAGLQVEFIDFAKDGDPYEASPRLAIEDIRNNNHMWVFSTRDGFGTQADFDPAENPLLEETDFIISGQRALANDIFRIVHDYFGHVKEGVGFRADGEENAWRAHAAMYSPLARRAMTTETRGQNSWVNFGSHGETNRTASAAETVFADQKTGLLPEWVSQEGAGDEDAGVKFSRKSTASEDSTSEGARQVGDQTPNRKSIPDAVVQHNSLREMMRWAGTKTWADIRAFKVDLQNRVNQFAARRRVNVSVFDDAHADDYLRRVGVADALYALETNPGAIGWYDLTVRKALNILSLVYPELKTDPDAAMAFTWALAVTSNGIKVDQNFRMAAAAYEQYKKTGRLPTNLKAGPTQKAINQTLEMFNDLKFDNTVGIEGVRRLVNGMFTVSELKKLGFEISGESATTVVRGGAIAGPKIGNGFLSNLQGYFDQLTMDRWLIRTWGRWTGTLLDLRPDMVQEKSRELSGLIQGLSAENKKAVETQIGISLDADPVRIAHAVKKATGKDSVRRALAEIPGGDGIRLTGNALWKYDDAQKEAPHGPTERTRIRKVFRDILADLQKEYGHRGLTVADLQALLWYTERRLFDAAKVAEGAEAQAGYEADEAPDYANASAALARSKGISDADINAAIQEAENGTGQSAPDVGAGRVERGNRGGGTDLRSLRGQEAATAAFGVRSNLGRVPASAAFFPGRANQSTPGRASGSYARKSGRSAGEVRRIGRTDVQPKYVYNPKSAIQAYLAPQGQATPTYIELDAGKDAGVFRRLIHAAAKSIPEGAAVRVYPKKYYQGLRLFLTEDGTAGFALQGDDIVSVFRHGKSPHKGFATSMLALAVDEGGRTLDAFDTVLPKLYSSYGFRAVARVKWDESQRPEGWDKDVFRDFNGGEPDVVLMVYDAGNRDTYKAGDGRLFSNFDDAAAYRDAEKARLQEQHGILFSRAAEARNDRQTEDTRRAATPSDQRRVERLNAAIGRYLGGREQAGAAATVPGRADRRLARALGKALGKRVVFFKAKAGSFLDSVDGASSERDNNVLFVNVDAKSPLAITGHEFLHALRRDDPALYEWVKRELLPELKNTERFRAFLDGARDAEGVGKTDDDLLIEELLANALGDRFLEPEFWARVAQRDGNRFQQLLRRLRRFINRILRNTPPDALQSSEYFQDLEKVRDVMSDMLRAYKLRQEDPSKFQARTDQGAAFARTLATGATRKEQKQAAAPGIIAAAGWTPAERDAWREANRVNQRQQRVPAVAGAARDLRDGKITSAEYRAIVAKHQPIKPFTKVPPLPSIKEIIGSINESQIGTGVIGLNKDIPDGTPVGLRLDIPAYETFDTWVVSIHDGAKKGGAAMGYGQTGYIRDVSFKSESRAAHNIAIGETESGKPAAKSTIARMYGGWINHSPTELHKRAQELMNNPDWVQVGMNPFRVSYFYDKRDMRPVASADEVIQVGALVLAKNPTYTSPDDDQFQYQTRSGTDVRFSRKRNPQTKTPAFKRWFGNSVVVDGDGEPLVLYHATSADILSFDPKAATIYKDAKSAIFLTTDVDVAETYLPSVWYTPDGKGVEKAYGDGSNIMPVYVKIENPMVVDYFGGGYKENEFADFIKEAKKEGHDGIFFKNVRDPGIGSLGRPKIAHTVVAFKPTQIKSATGNQGTFDPDNPDIRFSRQRPATADPFYSALRQTIERAEGAPKSAPAQQWSQWMDGQQRKGRIRQEERDWLGVDAWLAEQDGKISRAFVQQFTMANQVRVTEQVLTEGEDAERQGKAGKYTDYQLPGGTNYRELLLTLPATGQTERFQSNHWDDPNVLAHVRVNERAGDDGARTLFMEELQSDWHQQGKKQGYGGAQARFVKEQGKGGWYIRDRSTNKLSNSPLPENQIDDMLAAAERRGTNSMGVPDAPFKTSWPLLAMKRVIRWAAENGFDQIAWTTGQQQADRFDADADAMTGFYDKQLPNLVGKYTRKWGAQVEKRTVNQDTGEVWSVLVTPQMQDVVLSQGQPLFSRRMPNPQTETSAFKKWFGDSVVTEPDGKPKIVYHSSTYGDVSVFDKAHQSKGMAGYGFYFTDQDGSNIYANYGLKFQSYRDWQGNDKKVNVSPVYLVIKNPLVADDIQEINKLYGNKDPGDFGQGRKYGGMGADAITAIQRDGYDGVVTYEYVKEMRDGSLKIGEKGNKGYKKHPVYVVFEPTQIKSAIGNQGTFDPANPGIAFARRPPSPDPRINSFRSKIGTPPQAPLHRRVASYLRTLPSAIRGELSDRFRQGYLDRYYGLDRAEKQAHGALPAEQRAYVAARFSNNLSSVMRGVLEYGGLQWQDGIAQAKPGTTGLLPVLKPLAKAGELDDFLDWMVADRADRLMAEGRENLFDQAEIDAVKATLDTSPERRARWTQARNDYIDLQKSVLDFAQEAGLIDPTTRPLWERGDYIPFYRVDADRGILGAKNRAGLEGQSSGIKRLKGGTSNLNDPLENIIMNLTHLVDASMKNMAMQRAADNLQGIPGVMMPAKAEFKQQIIAMTEVKKAMMDTLREQGMTPRDARAYMSQIPASAWRGMRKMWSFQIPKAPDVVRVMRQGKPVYYQVEDPLLLRAFTSMDAAFGWRNNIAGQAAMAAKRVLTGAITVTPTFGIRNWTRDAVAASIITESKFKPILDSVLGAVRSLNPDNMQNIEMTFSGASFLSNEIAQAGGGARTARQLRRQLGRMNKHDLLARSMGVAATIWDRGYRRYLDGLENANRLAVYEAALERTGGSKAQASFEALDLMDFTLRGDSPIYNFFADVIPFLNARVQGLYRLGRAPKTADSRWNPNFIIGSTILTVASLGLYALNKDREEWDDLEDWDRDTNFHLWLGGEHYTIPKPFELGFVFGTVPERVAATLYEKDHDFKRLVDRLQTGFSETLAFDPRPQLIKPLVELANNKDSFTGRDIVSVTEAGRLQEDQYGPGTSELAKNVSKAVAPAARKLDKATGVGESMALAPDQIDHLIRGYFGAVGTTAVMLFDAAERTVRRGLGQTIPSPAEMRVDQYPIIRAFYRAAPELRNRYVTEFYNLYRETDQVYRSLNFRLKDGLVDRAQGLVDENQRALATRPLMQGGLQTMREIRGQMRAIRNDPNLDGREKRQRLDALTVQRNQLAKHAVQAVR